MAEQEQTEKYVEMGAEMVVFDIKEARIAELREEFMKLTIKDKDDKPGFDAVHKARMEIKGIRVGLTKRGKDYRDKINVYLKKELAEEKKLLALLEPIEDHLSQEENRVEEEKARIKAEEEAKRAAIIQARRDQLYKLDCRFDGTTWTYCGVEIFTHVKLLAASDEQFNDLTESIQQAINEAAEVLAKEAAEKKRLDDEREAQASKERDALADEKRKLGIKIFVSSLRDIYITPSMNSADIETCIANYEQRDLSPETFQEFRDEALEIHKNTVGSLRKILSDTKTREEEAVKLQAEKDRLAKEKADQEKEAQRLKDEAQRLKDEEAAKVQAAADTKKKEEEEAQRKKDLESARQEERRKARHDMLLLVGIENNEPSLGEVSETDWQQLYNTAAGIWNQKQKTIAEAEAQKKADAAAAEKKAKEDAVRIKAEKKEARRPDKAKLLSYIQDLYETEIPEMKTEEGQAVSEVLQAALNAVLAEQKTNIEEKM
jgi:colicin import membrane protein